MVSANLMSSEDCCVALFFLITIYKWLHDLTP